MIRKTSAPSIDLVMLGTGGAFTDYRTNYHNNAAVRTQEGWVLIDCGGTAIQSLKELNISPHEVCAVIVTHMHGDHVGGIEQLIWERFYTGPEGFPVWAKTKIICPADLKGDIYQFLEPCLREFTGSDGTIWQGGADKLVEWEMTHSKFLSPIFEETADPISGEKLILRKDPPTHIDVGNVRFTFFNVPHSDKKAYGLRIESNNTHIIFTSDTTFRGDVVESWVQDGAQAVFHDCMFFPLYPGTVHTHFVQLMELPDEVKRRVILMHHTKVPRDSWGDTAAFLWAANRHDHFLFSQNRLRIRRSNGDAFQVRQPGTLGNDGNLVSYEPPGINDGLF